MRLYKQYKNEISITTPIKKDESGPKAETVQQWLNYYKELNGDENLISIDSDFGDKTLTAVKEFQVKKNLPVTGIVDPETFSIMTAPLRKVFTANDFKYKDFRDLICQIAEFHAAQRPIEFNSKREGTVFPNTGPWVRSYLDDDKDLQSWCMGFVQAIFDQACDITKIPFKSIMPKSPGCDETALFALNNGRLIRGKDLKAPFTGIKPGDIFFKYSPDNGDEWHHVGIITGIDAAGNIATIEGNAAKGAEGHIGDTSDGTGTFKKTRTLGESKSPGDLDEKGNKMNHHDYYEVYKINFE